ncbi:hypothetical protein HAX54_033310 [Datura stramonium]|uniref:Late blight resistance protein R1A-like N-terminal domain-containing protein n=1 Tax=Datura stramonium TaxID=4076 RepID=A0ABS8SDI8_DATST|nr:hypothetical protein [Datura stramonium]
MSTATAITLSAERRDICLNTKLIPSKYCSVLKRNGCLERMLISYKICGGEKKYSSFCVLEDRSLSQIYHYLDTLERVEEEYCSFHVFSDNGHLLETAKRIQREGSSSHANKYPSSKGPDVTSTLKRMARECDSFYEVLSSYDFSEEYHPLDTLQRIEEDGDSLRVFIEEGMRFIPCIFGNVSILRGFSQWWECCSSNFIQKNHPLDPLKFLNRDFKFLGIILNLHDFKDEPHVVKQAQTLFQHAANALAHIQESRNYYSIHELLSHLQFKFQETKSEIRRTRYSFPEISFQLLANKDGIAIANFVMEFVDAVVENLELKRGRIQPIDPSICKIYMGVLQALKALVYSLTVEGETNQALVHDFSSKIRNNLMELLSHYSNSIDSVNSQLETIPEELKCFQAIVEQQDGLQHFVTQTNGLVYEVEYIFDSCKKKDVPDWCLFPWILGVGEDIRVLMAEVAEHQETNVFDLMLHNTTNGPERRYFFTIC